MNDTDLDSLLTALTETADPVRMGDLVLKIADLFVEDAERLSKDQVSVFDTILLRLVDGIEEAALARLADRLIPLEQAPPGVIHHLATDDRPHIFTPVLLHARSLGDDDLVEHARTLGESHLLAIADRKTVTEPVTDALIERKMPAVMRRVVANRGARMTQTGFATVVAGAATDDALALAVSARPDLPRTLLLRLISAASSTVRTRLEAANADRIAEIRRVVRESARQIAERLTTDWSRHEAAVAECRTLAADGKLGDDAIAKFARARDEVRVQAALAVLARLPVKAVVQQFAQQRKDGLLVLGRAVGLTWPTMRLVRQLPSSGPVGSADLEKAAFSFERLTIEAARMAIDVQRRRLAEAGAA